MHDVLSEAVFHSEEVRPEETQNGFIAAVPDGPRIEGETALPEPAAPKEVLANTETADEVAARKQLKKKLKAQHKAEKKGLKKKLDLKEKKSSTKVLAGAFPMVALIDEQVRTSIPPELVAKVKAAKSKKIIINPNYPYPKQMKESEYLEEVELLQIELVKMQAWVKEVGERIVLIFEGRDAAGKGGTIQRFTENLNPRGAKVVALAKTLGHGAGPVVLPALHRKASH